MSATATIARRFHGPPGSGNGGYACGVAASLADGPVEVALTAPPPLDVEVQRDGDDVVGPDGAWARLLPAPDSIDVIDPVAPDVSSAATDDFDVDAYRSTHIFPTCFTCGPDRDEGDGLRLFPAPVPGRAGVVTWPWVPGDRDVDDAGLIPSEVMWAALDCPSGLAWSEDDLPFVLGRLAAEIHRRPSPGEALVTAGWRKDREGRRLGAGSAVWAGDGELLAAATATWVVLTPEQATAFSGG